MTSGTHAIWQQDLLQALALNQAKPESKYVQLATVNTLGLPEVRTVVFRGFIENTCKIVIHTDQRSGKVEHLQAQTDVEICWYFAESREQFRIAAKAELVDQDNADQRNLRSEHWSQLSDAAKSSYFWPQPGQVLGLNQPEFEPQVNVAPVTLSHISEHFSLVILHPYKVDHLQLTSPYHQRKIFELHGDDWRHRQINP